MISVFNYYKTENDLHTIICLYVDDLLIFGSNLYIVNTVKSLLCASFDMKDLGEANLILIIKVTKTETGFTLDQFHYIEKILKKYGFDMSKPAFTPYDRSKH